MSGSYTLHLVPGASRILARIIQNDRPILGPDAATWPTLAGGYLRLDHNAGHLDWSSALLFDLHARRLVRRFHHGSTNIWSKNLDPRDRPFAPYLDGDRPMFPVGDPERARWERKRAEYERAARDLFNLACLKPRSAT